MATTFSPDFLHLAYRSSALEGLSASFRSHFSARCCGIERALQCASIYRYVRSLSSITCPTTAERYLHTEPAVSQSTHIKRHIRSAIVPRLIAFYIFLNNYTSLLVWYSAAQRQRNILEWRLQRWASEHEELGRMMVALFILAVILFLVSIMGGYVDLESTERVGRWMGMRQG